MKNEKKSSFESGLNKDKILSLIEELGIKLPDIPIQSEDLFYETLLEEYERSLTNLVEGVDEYLKILQELILSSTFMSFIAPAIIGFLNKYQDKALDELTQKQKQKLLKNSVTSAELKIQSMTDHLTKLGSRKAFDETINRKYQWLIKAEPLWKEKNISKKIVLICIIDLDDFKNINDTYGHLFGDKFLKQVATTLNGVIKQETDSTFRIGGDEFALIIQIDENDLMGYGKTIDEATLNFSKKIHSRISNNEFEIEYKENTIKIKSMVSMRVNKINTDKPINYTKIKADEKLYIAKLEKNEVVA